MKAAPQHYHARMQRVLDQIEQHLDGDLDLDLEAMSVVAPSRNTVSIGSLR